jgi:hypothetical protein
MGNVVYSTKYKKNTGAVLNPVELRDMYLYGINLKSRDGTELPVYVWEQKIRAAQDQIEKFLAIKLVRQLVTESCTYFQDDYLNSLPIIPTSLPVYKPVRLLGLLNQNEQIKYPIEWINNYKCSDDMATRRINLVPSGAATGAATNVVLIGVFAQLGIRSLAMVPNYWNCQYLTGWAPDKLPQEIMDLVGKLASISILSIYGDLVLAPGLSGQSLSIDGLSQSLNTVINARGGAFSGRIAQYLEDIKVTLERLKRNYLGINFVVL